MRQLQLIAHGEPSDVIELNTVFEPVLGQEEVLVSMEAAPLNPSDFTLVRGIYGVRPALPFSMGSEGVGRVVKTGSKVDVALQGKRVLILPTYEQGTWADQVVVPVRNIVPMSDEADPLQLSMIGINPATAYLLLNRYVSLMPGDWIGQTAANSAMGQYIIALAKLAGVKTLNVVRQRRTDISEITPYPDISQKSRNRRDWPISDIQRIETISAVFLGWLAAKPRSISSAGSEGLRDKTAVIDSTAAAFDVYPVTNRTLSVGERL
jgi:D-arabinose 1-dehydrogenase-like Zn-dependent alcohol dehydrogenase